MKKTRRKFTAEFKARVAIEAVKEHKTLAELPEQSFVTSDTVLQLAEQGPLTVTMIHVPVVPDVQSQSAAA